jgi:hypothetical protein
LDSSEHRLPRKFSASHRFVIPAVYGFHVFSHTQNFSFLKSVASPGIKPETLEHDAIAMSKK